MSGSYLDKAVSMFINNDIPLDEKCVLMFMCAKTTDGNLSISNRELLGLTRFTPERLKKTINSLVQRGWLVLLRRGGGQIVTQYEITLEGGLNPGGVKSRGGQKQGGSNPEGGRNIPPPKSNTIVTNNPPIESSTSPSYINIDINKDINNTGEPKHKYSSVIEILREIKDYNLNPGKEHNLMNRLLKMNVSVERAERCASEIYTNLFSHHSKDGSIQWCYRQSVSGNKKGYHQNLDGCYWNWLLRDIKQNRNARRNKTNVTPPTQSTWSDIASKRNAITNAEDA